MSESLDSYEYEVVVVGGGPAGMTAALYSTRLGHDTAVVNRGGGRAAMMQEVHNLLGVKEETSGAEFLGIGQEQLEAYGCDIHRDMITTCSRPDSDGIRLSGNNAEYEADRVVLAINSVGRLASFAGIVSDTPGWVAVLGLTIAIGMLLGYLLFSAASLRAGIHSRTVGLLLLAPLAIFAVMLSGIADMVVSHSLALVILASGQAVAHLAIGAALRNGSVPTDRAEPTPDTVAK